MKREIKKILKSLGIIDSARFVYGTARHTTFKTVPQEIIYRIKGLPDKNPYPPAKLIFLIIGHGLVSEYFNSGKIIVSEMLADLKRNNISLSAGKRILDFGCGSGRLIRHLAALQEIELYGSDYNKILINWCSENLPFGKFKTNNLTPPLTYENNYFDYIYARSVFTHLGEELQIKWIKEIHRILKNEGVFYFSTHGENFVKNLNDVQKQCYDAGEVIVENIGIEGDNKCASFQSPKFVETKLLEGFKLVDFIPGGSRKTLGQDVYIVQKM